MKDGKVQISTTNYLNHFLIGVKNKKIVNITIDIA